MENMELNFWQDKRILVTGATGIVGSWLVKELLERGAYTVALLRDADPQSELFRSGDLNRIHVVNGQLEDFTALERAVNKHEVDTVFHLGAQAIVGTALRSPLATFEANIRGTFNLLEACRQHSDLVRRVVVASSDKAYGESAHLPYTEEMPLNGRYPYEVSKSCTDLISQSYFHTYGLAVTVARCGNIYGGGDLNWSRIVPGTIRSLAQGKRPVIRSDGLYLRDYIYVKDIVRAYLCLAERSGKKNVKGGAFNFGPEKPFSVLEIVGVLQRLMGCENLTPEIVNNVQGEIKNQYLSSAKAEKLLGWKPEYSLEIGLQETVDWYQRYFIRAR